MERLVDINEVSALLGAKKSTIRKWIFEGKIPFLRIGRLIRFRLSTIETWLEAK